MWKRILSAVVVSQILLSSAFAANTSALKSAFDDLNYVLTIEWDQKDPEVAKNAINDFAQVTANATVEEKTEFFRSLLPGKELEAQNFVERLNSMNNEQAIHELKEITGVYSQGASYHPIKYVAIGAGIMATIFVAGLLMWELSGPPDIWGDGGWNG